MDEPTAAGFWSYAHADDDAGEGALRRLAERIGAEYALLTGGDLDLFVDRQSLRWGEEWRTRVDGALAAFRAEARRGGLERLLLPVYWVNVQALEDGGDYDDEVMSLVAATQHEGLRAVRLVEAATTVTESVPDVVTTPPSDTDEDWSLDNLLAEGEQAAERLPGVLTELAAAVGDVGTLMELSAPDGRGAGLDARATERLAGHLAEPAARIARLGHEYASTLVAVDPAILAMIDLAAADADIREDAGEFFQSISAIPEAAEPAMERLRALIEVVDDAARLSRT